MAHLHGEYECRIDEKGRIIIPAGLKKQISPKAQDRFMVKRGFEGCLNIFPMDEWEVEVETVDKLNLFEKEKRKFMRNFMKGATEVTSDGSNRILIPKLLLEHAQIDKDVVLSAFSNRIEVWAKEVYDSQSDLSEEDLANLADRVLGDRSKTQD
jgi:MraZ protein